MGALPGEHLPRAAVLACPGLRLRLERRHVMYVYAKFSQH